MANLAVINSPYRSHLLPEQTVQVKEALSVATADSDYLRLGALVTAAGNLGEPQLAYTNDAGTQRRLGYMGALSRTNGALIGTTVNPTAGVIGYEYMLNGRQATISWYSITVTKGSAAGEVRIHFPVSDNDVSPYVFTTPHGRNLTAFPHATAGTQVGLVKQAIEYDAGNSIIVLTFEVIDSTAGTTAANLDWADVGTSIVVSGEFSYLTDVS